MKQTFLIGIIVTLPVLGVACNRSSSNADGPAPAAAPAAQSPVLPAGVSKRIPAPTMADLHGAPPPSDETRGELFDVARDIEALSSWDESAQKDLADDLLGLSRRMSQPPTPQAIDAVVASLAQATKGKTLSVEQQTKIATLLYASVYASELRESDRAELAADLTASLKAAGALEAPAMAAGRSASRLGVTAAAKR